MDDIRLTVPPRARAAASLCLRQLVVYRAAGLAPEEGVPIILPNRMPGDSTRYANGMPDGWGDGDERPSDEYIACDYAQRALRDGNHGTDGRIDSDLFARLRDGEGLEEWQTQAATLT